MDNQKDTLDVTGSVHIVFPYHLSTPALLIFGVSNSNDKRSIVASRCPCTKKPKTLAVVDDVQGVQGDRAKNYILSEFDFSGSEYFFNQSILIEWI